jgi:hypothetical protein
MFEVRRYKVIEKWECDYIHESKITQSLLTTLRHHNFFTHINLNPRDARFGG